MTKSIRKKSLRERFEEACTFSADKAPEHGMPLVFAHRGASNTAPENTLAAIRLAATLGADGVEIDVRLTKDGVPVLMHDSSVDRTTNGTGNVRDLTLKQIRTLDAGQKKSPHFKGEQVPTLKDALKLCAQLDLRVVIDIKPDKGKEQAQTERIIRVADNNWPAGKNPPTINTEIIKVLETAQRVKPDWPRAIIFFRPYLSWKKQLKVSTTLSAGTIFLGSRWLAAIARFGRSRCKNLSAWTVNNSKTAIRLANLGFDVLYTDKPAEIKGALKENFAKRKTRLWKRLSAKLLRP